MGVPQFLKEVLGSVGRPIDLRYYAAAGILPAELEFETTAAVTPTTSGGDDLPPLSPPPEPVSDRSNSNESTSRRFDQDPPSLPRSVIDPSRMSQPYRDNQRRRPIRIAVDVSTWIHKASQGFGDMLADERHLSNYGRATLVLQQQQQQHQQETAAPSSDAMESTPEDDTLALAQRQLPPEADPAMVQRYIMVCTNYVVQRLETLKNTSNGEILVVFDGATPPIKRNEVRERSIVREEALALRDQPINVDDEYAEECDNNGDMDQIELARTRAFRRSGAGKYFSDIITSILEALRSAHIPFMVAPYEADGQLAYLRQRQLIDLIVTEDSDLSAYGASPVLYKLSQHIGDGVPRGTLLRHEDMGASTGSLDLRDYTPAMLAVLFVAVGSDYCHKLKGIGIARAGYVIRSAFYLDESNPNGPHHRQPPLALVFEGLYSATTDRSMLTPTFRENYEECFLKALIMFRHPVVFDPVLGRCVISHDPTNPMAQYGCFDGDTELWKYEPYANMCQNINFRYEHVTGSPILPHNMAVIMAEGWLTPKTFELRPHISIPKHVQKIYQEAREKNENGEVESSEEAVDVHKNKVSSFVDMVSDDPQLPLTEFEDDADTLERAHTQVLT